jgi:hypothetical protein
MFVFKFFFKFVQYSGMRLHLFKLYSKRQNPKASIIQRPAYRYSQCLLLSLHQFAATRDCTSKGDDRRQDLLMFGNTV